MWCLTKEESRDWCEGRGLTLDAAAHPVVDGRAHSIITPFSGTNFSKLLWLSDVLAAGLVPFDECLLWVTLWGVWSSSENWHLFYRLRETYGERRRLWHAPGHLFLKHESPDLTTFIQLALIFGWDFYLIPAPGYHAAFVSHDEYLKFSTNDGETADRVQHCLDKTPQKLMGKE
jgi:hypothetical protein